MRLFPPTRRDVLRKLGAATMALATASLAPPRAFAQGTIRKRKNIESLSSDELSVYKHAIQVLKDHSSDPNDPKGYAYWAALHDLFDESIHSGCAHFSEKFFPWHRRYLYDFEVALQNSDPPATKDVMIPYWDWTTKTTSGSNYPAAFEDRASPLFDGTRFTISQPPWDPDDIRTMVREPDWSLFAGKPDASNGFGRNPGSVEFGPHNTLHTNISRDMADPQSAVQDSIFWSFHSGIDLCWSRWQHLHLSDTRPQPFFDSEAVLWFQDRSFTVGSTAKTTDYFYDYDYDYSADGSAGVAATPTVVAQASITGPPRSVIPFAAGPEKDRNMTMEPTKASSSSEVLRLADVKYFGNRSYRLNLYLHPKTVDVTSLDANARQEYLMRTITLWKAHHDGTAEMFVRPTPAQAAHLGEGWVVTIQSEDVVREAAAPTPHTGHAEAAVPALPPTSALVKSLELQER